MLEKSIVESNRFGFNVFRCVVDDLDLEKLNKEILEKNADLVILRIPFSKRNQIQTDKNSLFPHIIADSLVYYESDLTNHKQKSLRNTELDFVIFDSSSYQLMDELVEKIFSGYQNHYHQNPYINSDYFMVGYKEWAKNFAKGLKKENNAWLIKSHGQFIGFWTFTENKDNDSGEVVLGGIIPEASCRGIYRDLICSSQNYFQSMGISKLKVSTQIENHAVQKVWMREGFLMNQVLATVHINSFLKHSQIPPIIAPFSMTTTVNNSNPFTNDYKKLNEYLTLVQTEVLRLLELHFQHLKIQELI